MVQSFNRKTYRPTTIYTTGVPVCVLNQCLFNHAYCVCFVVPSVLPERYRLLMFFFLSSPSLHPTPPLSDIFLGPKASFAYMLQTIALVLLVDAATANRALVADLSTDARVSGTGRPTGKRAHVGECKSEVRQQNGATGQHCSGKLYLTNNPGNTGYYKFTNINGKGMIG